MDGDTDRLYQMMRELREEVVGYRADLNGRLRRLEASEAHRQGAEHGKGSVARLVAGCGGGDAVRDWLPPCVAHAGRLILDADALNAVAREPALTAALQARGARGRPTLLTPHPLEAGRLLGQDAAAIQADRPTAVRLLAARFGATVVLKGSGTLAATPDGRLYVNATGNARLASAGTGDVLAGWTAGLWSRSGGDAIEAASRAVFRHGLAAERADGTGPLLAADLIHAMQAL